MKVCVKSREDRKDALNLAYAIAGVLGSNGHTVVKELEKDCNLVVVVGGDGTILSTVREMGDYQIPIIGVNKGGVGFLADLDADEALDFIGSIDNEFILNVEERTRISATRTYPDHFDLYEPGLNEFAIISDTIGKAVTFTIWIDGGIAQTFRADGLIVSTPTGSTAYAMSAGGSIVDPRIKDVFLVVPIAPFLLSSRPQLVSAKRDLRISIERDQSVSVVVDGKFVDHINRHDVDLVFHQSNYPAKFVDAYKDFFRNVGDKLRRM